MEEDNSTELTSIILIIKKHIEKGRGFNSDSINERRKRYEGKSGIFDQLDNEGSGPAKYIFF